MIRIKRNPRNEKIINDLIIKRKRIRSEPPVFHELYSYDIYYQNEKIGYVWVNKTNSWVNKVEILYPEYRRQGINSYVYDHIEKDLNIKLKPSGNLSSDGAAFWQNRSKKSNPTDYKLLKDIKIKKLRIFEPIGRNPNRHYLEYKILLNNKQIGYAMMEENTNFISLVEIHDAFQRSGLNTYLYNYIENDLNIKLVPSKSQSSDGKAFWKNRK